MRLPSRRSSPDGLPVFAASPKTPSTSSRSWNAIPSGCPKAARAADCGRSAPASAAPIARGCCTLYRADFSEATRSARRRVAIVGLGAKRGLLGDVEELADRHLASHGGVRRAGGDRVRDGCRTQALFEQIVAPRNQQVAEQDGRRATEGRRIPDPSRVAMRALERAMRCRTPTTGVGVVDHVVVDQRRGVEDLERRRRRDDRERSLAGGTGCLGDGAPAGDAEAAAQAFAARDRSFRRRHQERRFGSQIGGGFPLTGDKVVQSLGNRFDRVEGGFHGPSLVIYGTRRIYASEPARGGCMPLSEQEQRLLDEMERHLMRNDADVVSAQRDGRTLSYRNIVYGTVLVLLGLGGLIVGVAVGAVAGIIVGRDRIPGRCSAASSSPSRRPAMPTHLPPDPKTPDPARSSTSFMDRMNDRWDKRQGDR